MRHLRAIRFLGSLLVGLVASVVYRKVRRKKLVMDHFESMIFPRKDLL